MSYSGFLLLCLVLGLRDCMDTVVVLTESGSLNFTLKLRIVYAELLERSAFVNSSAKLLSVTFITLSSSEV